MLRTLDSFDIAFQTSVSTQTIRDLATLQFVEAHESCAKARERLGGPCSMKKMNAEKARKPILGLGFDKTWADRVSQMFTTVDPSHHAQEDYAPNRERVRIYADWVEQVMRGLGEKA